MLMTATTRFDTAFLEAATGGTAVGRPEGDRVVTDSRLPVVNALFVALAGPTFDGHDFVEAALRDGAGGAVVSAAWWEGGRRSASPLLVVPDPLAALQDLARAHRRRHPIPLAAVTGSNGKTTTKELLAAALSPLGPVLKTRGNLNNHIGLPLTLLDLAPEHTVGVVEIGLNHPGELGGLSRLAGPRVAVITNVAAAHLEGLGTVAGVARAKAEIVEGLEPGGVLVVPAGSAPLAEALAGYRGRRLTFGLEAGADVHPTEVRSRGLEGTTLVLPDGTVIESPLPGAHAAQNLLAAVAAAGALGVSPARAAGPLAGVAAGAGRFQIRRAGSVIVLDDTYNANPASLVAALRVLREHPAAGRRWAVLGDMLELGPETAALHRRAGAEADFLDGLVTVGALGRELGRGAVAAGLDPGRVHEAADGAAAGDWLASRLGPGDAILVKGSRGMRLETAVAALLAALGGEA